MKKLPLILLVCLFAVSAHAETMLCQRRSRGQDGQLLEPAASSQHPGLDAAKITSGDISLARIATSLAAGGGPIQRHSPGRQRPA